MQAFFIKQIKGEKSLSPFLTRLSERYFLPAKPSSLADRILRQYGNKILRSDPAIQCWDG
jgi:hypothetical protein